MTINVCDFSMKLDHSSNGRENLARLVAAFSFFSAYSACQEKQLRGPQKLHSHAGFLREE